MTPSIHPAVNGKWYGIDGPGITDDGHLSTIDPGLCRILSGMVAHSASSSVRAVDELIRMVEMDNPLDLHPSDRPSYRLTVGRFLLDEYISAGTCSNEGMVMDIVRRPGPTKCCNPYSDNMYRYLVSAASLELDVENDRFRVVFSDS